ncbi:hypothetical protein CDL15_Pgr026312 [Punica granatum]|uniref:Uncharacterized protein n=1 Tax=Punica granatum TaxID=22663 RepID=A0A218XX15_PUNGR|nr:hypothetical protein CDL15_Pgr026312 [Punica granatum]
MAVRIDPITLGPKDHHSHLRGSVRSQEPLTLSQNSIGSLRSDVRPNLCQSGLSSIPAGSVWCHSGLFIGKQPKTRPINGPTRLLKVPSRISGLVEKNIPTRERQRAHGFPSKGGDRMLSCSFRARNDLLDPIQA